MIKHLFKQFGQLKVYFISANFYMAVCNFVLLLATFKKVYNINIALYYIIPIGVLGILLVGFLDYNFVIKHQIKHTNKKNDIKLQLDRIEKNIKSENDKK